MTPRRMVCHDCHDCPTSKKTPPYQPGGGPLMSQYGHRHHRLNSDETPTVFALVYRELWRLYESQDPDDKRRMKLYSLQGGGEIKTEEEGPEEPDKDKLLDDIAEYFTKIDSTQADRNHLYAFIEKRHRLTQDEFEAILRGYPELFELDGWTVKIAEASQ